jgi:hypothetical protein
MIVYTSEQGTPEWLAERSGIPTGSRFKDCRDRTADGDLSARARLYAQDLARERCGGKPQSVYVNAAMRFGTEQEPMACAAYENEFGRIAEKAGFICTDDRKFGVSVDRLVEDDGLVEVKTTVSSATLFRVVVEQDIGEYEDQVYGQLWLLGRKWCDLVLWSPDLTEKPMNVIRVWRDDNIISRLESDLLSFDAVVSHYQGLLNRVLSGPVVIGNRSGTQPGRMVKTTLPATAPTAPRVSEFERLLKRVATARSTGEVDLLLDNIAHLPTDQIAALRLAAANRSAVGA